MIENNKEISITVKILTGVSKEKIIWCEDLKLFKVYVNSQREKGKANKNLIELFSNLLKIKTYNIKIENGFTTQNKTLLLKTELSIDNLKEIFKKE